MSKPFDVKAFPVERFDTILSRGLSLGPGIPGASVCIEAAVCEALGLPTGDDPGCVSRSVRAFKISLNDSPWSSPKARAAGLRDLGLAQLGSLGVVDDIEFTSRLAKAIIQVLIPRLFRQALGDFPIALACATRCEIEGSVDAARAAADAARAAARRAHVIEVARAAVDAVAAAGSAKSARAAAYAARAAAGSAKSARAAVWTVKIVESANSDTYTAWFDSADSDQYLVLAAKLALNVLREMGSPGIALLDNPTHL
jgi:hypothetical protein